MSPESPFCEGTRSVPRSDPTSGNDPKRRLDSPPDFLFINCSHRGLPFDFQPVNTLSPPLNPTLSSSLNPLDLRFTYLPSYFLTSFHSFYLPFFLSTFLFIYHLPVDLPCFGDRVRRNLLAFNASKTHFIYLTSRHILPLNLYIIFFL